MPNGVSGLESQFQSLGLQQQPGDDNAGVHGEGDGLEDLEGDSGDGEDDPLKLFVGQVSSNDAHKFVTQ